MRCPTCGKKGYKISCPICGNYLELDTELCEINNRDDYYFCPNCESNDKQSEPDNNYSVPDSEIYPEHLGPQAPIIPPKYDPYINVCWWCKSRIDSRIHKKSDVKDMGYHCPLCNRDLSEKFGKKQESYPYPNMDIPFVRPF